VKEEAESKQMLKGLPLLLTFVAMAVTAVPARAQMGGGGGGGGTGIPLGALGSHDDDKKDKPDKKSASERPVSGVVTDADGKPIVGAVVRLVNTQTQKVVSLITREKGEYQFSGLSKDVNYQLTAALKDHSSEPHTLSMYDSRPKPIVNLQIK
jgi:Carboxypeptidase regulatory-like domain